MANKEKIAAKLSRLPRKPGVYQFFDAEKKILYVGKAKDLKSRVSSYFGNSRHNSGKTRVLAKLVDDIRFLVVETEADALLLENSLIKKHQPRYNMQLKDDKSFPSIVIKKEHYPRIFPTRRILNDGSEYYGPYASVKNMHAVLDLIKKLYPIRTCNYNLSPENIAAGKFKVCLEYHLGNCLGPCEGLMSADDYNANVDSIRQILKGNYSDLIKSLKSQMKGQSTSMDFENAQFTKNKIEILENFQAKSTIVNPSIKKVDVFSIVSDKISGYVNYMKVNNGVIVNGYTIEIRKKLEETDDDLLAYAIPYIREKYNSQSRDIYISQPIDLNMEDIRIHLPQRGDKKQLIDLSLKNARFFMRDKQKQLDQVDPESSQKRIMATLKEDLHLQDTPVHIECFDNSNIQGTHPTSACVVFKMAKPSKEDYRKFNIKTVEGPDDFASMYEAVYRRYKRLSEEGNSLPQLVIIDGGKGQLSASVRALDDLKIRGKMAIIGIAKKLEEIYFPGDSLPLYIDKRSESLKLIQHMRNEAHRFSLAHHRNRRSKDALSTELTDIKGVGFRTAQDLIWNFKSVTRIKSASIKELEEVVNKRVARVVFEHFNE